MANITMQQNRSKEGNIVVSADDNGIDIVDSGINVHSMGNVVGPSSSIDGNVVVFDGTTGKIIRDRGIGLTTDGPGTSFLSDDGTYKTVGGGGGTNEKKSTYQIDFNSATGFIRPTGTLPSNIIPLSEIISSAAGNPVTSTTATQWILEPGNYWFELELYISWAGGSGGSHTVTGDLFRIDLVGLDVPPLPLIQTPLITVPYQGVTGSVIEFSHFCRISVPNIGASNAVSIQFFYVSAVASDFYFLQAGNPSIVESTISFTKF